MLNTKTLMAAILVFMVLPTAAAVWALTHDSAKTFHGALYALSIGATYSLIQYRRSHRKTKDS